jgi:hypothetical protein
MRVSRVVPKTEICCLVVSDRIASVRRSPYQIDPQMPCGISLQNIRPFGHRTAKPNVKRFARSMVVGVPKRHVCAGGVTRSSSKRCKDDSQALTSQPEFNNNKGYVPMD